MAKLQLEVGELRHVATEHSRGVDVRTAA